MAEPNLENLKLGRRLKFWQGLGVISAISWICVASGVTNSKAAATRIDATAVVAHEFDLVNSKGRITARLASDPNDADSPNLVLKYPDDKAAILIGIDSKSGASISVLNSLGQPRATISEHANGPSVALFDENDKLRLLADTESHGSEIVIYDGALNKIWRVPSK